MIRIDKNCRSRFWKNWQSLFSSHTYIQQTDILERSYRTSLSCGEDLYKWHLCLISILPCMENWVWEHFSNFRVCDGTAILNTYTINQSINQRSNPSKCGKNDISENRIWKTVIFDCYYFQANQENHCFRNKQLSGNQKPTCLARVFCQVCYLSVCLSACMSVYVCVCVCMCV